MTTRNRGWILARRPVGNDFESALELGERPLPALADGEVLIRNAYLSMDAGTRMWMNPREDSYQPPTPVGAPVEGLVMGAVVASRHPDFREGDLVRTFGQWADYSIGRPDLIEVSRLTRRLSDPRQHLGALGLNGWTAYVGALETGAAKPGETFVVSAAAGATGSLAGQIAKAHGCRVIGIAGGTEKCRWIQDEFGFDAAIDYKAENVEERLRALCPAGIDVYFDNVAGPILDAVLANMALFGRVAVCGVLTHYDREDPIPGPYKFDMVLMRRLRIEGFFLPDFAHRGAEITRRLQPLYEAGTLKMPFEVTEGLENTLAAYGKLFTGANRGKVLVEVASL